MHKKLEKLTDGTAAEMRVFCSSVSQGSRENKLSYQQAICEGIGCLVVANTATQIQHSIDAINLYRMGNDARKFDIIVDECDDFYRTADGALKLEQAMTKLLALKPVLNVQISATPIPVILKHAIEILDAQDRNLDVPRDASMQAFRPSPEYVGIEDMKPLNVHGKGVFLQQNELSLKTKLLFEVDICDGTTVKESIPFANEKVKALYDDALYSTTSRGMAKTGVLILHCSCPRVYTPGNVYEQGENLQLMFNQEGTDLIIITVVGKGVSVKYPEDDWHHSWDNPERRDVEASDIIREIDNDDQYVLQTPVAVLGYFKLNRGLSIRSDLRVPTHMISSLGRGYNCGAVSQNMGRATGNGKSGLNNNGFKHVTMLATDSDFQMVRAMVQFLKEVQQRLADGETFVESVTGSNTRFPDAINFARYTYRELGSVRGLRKKFKLMVQYEELTRLSEYDKRTKERFWNDMPMQQLLVTLLLKGQDNETEYSEEMVAADIEGEYESLFGERPNNIKKMLQRLIDNGIIDKEKGVWAGKSDFFYTVPSFRKMKVYINKEVINNRFGDIVGSDSERSSGENTSESSENDISESEYEVNNAANESRVESYDCESDDIQSSDGSEVESEFEVDSTISESVASSCNEDSEGDDSSDDSVLQSRPVTPSPKKASRKRIRSCDL